MRPPRSHLAEPGPLTMPIVVVLLFTGIMAMVDYQLNQMIHTQPPYVLYLRIEGNAWPFDLVLRTLRVVVLLLIGWLWVAYRANRGRRGVWEALPYLGAALLLVYLQTATSRALASPPLIGTIERIVP